MKLRTLHENLMCLLFSGTGWPITMVTFITSWCSVISTQAHGNKTGMTRHRGTADCKMQILWAQRASQHKAHFLYNPSSPFQFTWGVPSGRTITIHLIWFLPGITFLCGGPHRDFLCWYKTEDQLSSLEEQWFLFIQSKTMKQTAWNQSKVYISHFTIHEK